MDADGAGSSAGAAAANADLIRQFYTAFAEKDGAAMAAFYHPDARFSDPVFPDLGSGEVRNMWLMLCAQGRDLQVDFSYVKADSDRGSAVWTALYSFSRTGRTVKNIVRAEFEFRDGLIYRHRDSFNLWKWAAMALGPAGLLLGWSAPVRKRIRSSAAASLTRYMDKAVTDISGDNS